MSELKTYKMVDENYCTDCVCVIPSEVYIKSEADKVIEELNRKIKLYEDLGSCKKGCLALRHNQRRVESEIYRVKLKEKEILRHKYKRCLAMAERWLFAFYVTNKCNDKFYLRSLKYRELAEKFKEEK